MRRTVCESPTTERVIRPSAPSGAVPAGASCGRDDELREQWSRHREDLLRYASRILAGDVHTAEDVVQETAIRLWQHAEVLDDDRPLAGWLNTVARNIVTDLTRRRRARPVETVLGSEVHGVQPDGLDHVHAEASITALLSTLSPRHRIALFEVYVRDRPIAEVAADLGVPTGTVKSRCHTAVHQLRATLTTGRL